MNQKDNPKQNQHETSVSRKNNSLNLPKLNEKQLSSLAGGPEMIVVRPD